MGTFGDIRAKFEYAWLYESKMLSDDKSVTMYFRDLTKKNYQGDANSKRGYHLRFSLGSSIDASIEAIKQIISQVAFEDDYELKIVEPGDFKNGARSGQFFTYIAIFNKNVELDKRTQAKSGTSVVFSNNQVAEGSVSPKALTPTGLRLKEDVAYTPQALVSDAKSAIERQYGQKPAIAMPLMGLVDAVAGHSSKHRFNSPIEIADIDDVISLNNELAEAMNAMGPADVAIIGKDFGEVLGGIYLMGISGYEEGVLFPSGNNPIIDFYMDGYGVSSKYKKGAAPTLTGVINNLKEDQLTTDDEIELNKMFNILKQYGVAESYLEIGKLLNAPGVLKLAEMLGVQPGQLTVDMLQSAAIDMQSRGGKPMEELHDYYAVMNRQPGGTIDWRRFKSDKSWHGIYTGPLSYHVVDLLNGAVGSEKYINALNAIMRKVEVKQLYLDFILKKDAMEFKMRAFTNPKAKFEFTAPNQSVYNPSNGKLGFKMK